jgi:sulfur-oxidizing protein SoxX
MHLNSPSTVASNLVTNIRLKFVRLHLGSLILFALSGCATYPDYATQFRFPIEWGNIAEGQRAFVDLECHQCHTVNGVNMMSYDGESPLTLELGGTIAYAKTYADLVTSIINPNHVVSDEYLSMLPPDARRGTTTIMPFKDQMTVTQLIDLVMFLNSRYVLMDGYSEIYYR